ncbi:unnamed protein product [Penicillium olsonii]|nr:unnamed protein product [Penicillium olsonii]CAG7933754.1 unnamed protein product [Penicillium olsonii]
MDSTDQTLFFSPGSVLVAFLTVAFLIRQAWPRFVDLKYVKCQTKPAPVSSLSVSKEPEIPEGWLGDSGIFELERRAIFSQAWIYLAHNTQLTKPGMYQSFDIAGFPVFVIRGKDGEIRAFHNVCRHRAYTITRKETGASTVLGCRYHGWSYDTTGRLVKAPQFDQVPGFDKSQNSLFEIHTHTTKQGLILVNLNAEKPTNLDDEAVSTLDALFQASGWQQNSIWVAGQTVSGDFNWKSPMDVSRLEAFSTDLGNSLPRPSGLSTLKMALRRILKASPSTNRFHFPTAFFHHVIHTDFLIALSLFPTSAEKTNIRCDIFSCSPIVQKEREAISKTLGSASKRFNQEIEDEFQIASKRECNTFELRDQVTRETLRRVHEHRKLERTHGSEIHPAMRKPKGSNLFQQAEKLCKELDCMSGISQNSSSPDVLDW